MSALLGGFIALIAALAGGLVVWLTGRKKSAPAPAAPARPLPLPQSAADAVAKGEAVTTAVAKEDPEALRRAIDAVLQDAARD